MRIDPDELKKRLEPVEGWLSDIEGWQLYELARQCKGKGVIVEIGSWKGRSTICLGLGSRDGPGSDVYAIDPHTGTIETRELCGDVDTFPEFEANIERAGLTNIVIPVVEPAEEAVKYFFHPVELIFIDGSHSYELVRRDFDLWFPKVISGGIMAFHDATCWPGPMAVVAESMLHSMRFRQVRTTGSIVYATKVI